MGGPIYDDKTELAHEEPEQDAEAKAAAKTEAPGADVEQPSGAGEQQQPAAEGEAK